MRILTKIQKKKAMSKKRGSLNRKTGKTSPRKARKTHWKSR